MYRPVGLREMMMVLDSGNRRFPDREQGQSVFYPTYSAVHATQMARDWHTKDPYAGFAGFVTAFDMEEEYLQALPLTDRNGKKRQELKIPSSDLAEFNTHIQGPIRITKCFFGAGYTGPVPKTGPMQGMDASDQLDYLQQTFAHDRESFEHTLRHWSNEIRVNVEYWKVFHQTQDEIQDFVNLLELSLPYIDE